MTVTQVHALADSGYKRDFIGCAVLNQTLKPTTNLLLR
jgi:hypothetical protein